MDEQPVALATSMRSPNSWLASFRYGVSPQPSQAPENSNSGWRTWDALHRVVRQQGAVQLRDGQEEVPVGPQPVPVHERRLHVDRLVLDLGLGLGRAHVDADAAAGAVVGSHLDGHQVTGEILGAEGLGQEARPGRRPRASGGKTFMRMAACGQTMAHLPQSMQMSGSQIGISVAMARFS